MNLCKCGCGILVKKNYKHGHGRRGKTNSKQHNHAISFANNKKITVKCKQCKNDFYITPSILLKGKGKYCTKDCYSKSMIGVAPPEQARINAIASNTGRKCSEETKRKISKANSQNNGFKNKHHTLESLKKISEASLKNWGNESYRNKILNDPKKKEYCRRGALEAAKKMSTLGYYDTKPELLMQSILNKLNIKFSHPFEIKNIEHFYLCDFYIPEYNLVIEVDGKYWHKYPNLREIDLIRNDELKNKGYNLIRVWENEFDLNTIKNLLAKMEKK